MCTRVHVTREMIPINANRKSTLLPPFISPSDFYSFCTSLRALVVFPAYFFRSYVRGCLVLHFGMSTITQRDYPPSGSHIWVQWEVEDNNGLVNLSWFRAHVLSSKPSHSTPTAVGMGTLVYDEYDPDTEYIVAFLNRQRVSVLYAPFHSDPTPCPWSYRSDNTVDDDEEFLPPRGSGAHNRTNGAYLTSELAAELEKVKAELESLRSVVNGLAANVYTQAAPRTSELAGELMSQLRVELIHLLARPSTSFVRRFSKRQTKVHLETLSYGEILRSFEAKSFRVSFNLFRTFVSDREATLSSSQRTHTVFDPMLPYSVVVPERGRKYTVQFQTFADLCAWIGMNDPTIQKKALVRTSKGILRVLGSLVADPGREARQLPILPDSKKAKKASLSLPPSVSPSVKHASSNVVNGQVIALAPYVASPLPGHQPENSALADKLLVPPEAKIASPDIKNGRVIPVVPLVRSLDHGQQPIPLMNQLHSQIRPSASNKPVDPRVRPSSITKAGDPRKRLVAIKKPVVLKLSSPPYQGPLYVFPGFSVLSVTKVEDTTEVQSVPHVPSLFISNASYNNFNRCFRSSFVPREIPIQSVRGPRPGTPEANYNSFFISWELDSPPASEFKHDLSVLSAFYGTLTLNIPTLSFKAPLTMAAVEKLLTEKMLSSVLRSPHSN